MGSRITQELSKRLKNCDAKVNTPPFISLTDLSPDTLTVSNLTLWRGTEKNEKLTLCTRNIQRLKIFVTRSQGTCLKSSRP